MKYTTEQEAIDAFNKQYGDEIVPFDGDNCEEDCIGWEVGEHRCYCGNRRVYLATEGDPLNGYYAYPCAY